MIFPTRWLQQAAPQSFFHREDIFPPEQAGLLYQKEKIATHHLLLYGLHAQPQVLALRPNSATDQRLYGKALTHKHTGVFLGERKPCSFEKPMNAKWMPPKPRTACEGPVSWERKDKGPPARSGGVEAKLCSRPRLHLPFPDKLGWLLSPTLILI